MKLSRENAQLLKSLLDHISNPEGRPFTILYAKDMRESNDLAYRAYREETIIVDLDRYYELGTINARDEEEAYWRMQGDYWSPEGEARPIITEAPIHHTSMSVGDLLKDGDRLRMVAPCGFVDINIVAEVEEWS